MEELLVKFDNFGFQYNAQAAPTLSGINLEIRRGEKLLIVGPSGCGKSTLIHCLNGLIPFSYKGEMTGSLTIKGKETKDMSLFEISKIVGTVLQDSDAQFVGMTVAEDIAFALENDCVEELEMKQKVQQVAKLVNVGELLTHAPGDLSGGQKQRVSMAGVMVDDVDILLFDEPLANLDPATGKQAVELIDQLQEKLGATVVIIEHRLEDVLWRDVDRIVLMQSGSIVLDTTPGELLIKNVLSENGIREPLYITALKYAKADLNNISGIENINSIKLDDVSKEKVRQWYRNTNVLKEERINRPLLSVKNIDFGYKSSSGSTRRVLNDVTFDVYEGEMLAVVGTNGAGKSTFAKVLCGFEKEDGGQILFEGNDIAGLSIKERAEHIGYIMQNPNQMISQVMIADEVALGLKVRGVPKEEIDSRVEKVLKICGLWKYRKWPISALSFGQKKRVTIASILILEPKLIILDEPTAGQDFRHYTEIMEFLKDINRRGITTVMITHDMHLMLEYADRAVVFSDGKVIADDKCASILTNPEIVERASLKQTSLYDLAVMCGLSDEGSEFVQRFIDFERSMEEGGASYAKSL